MTFSLLDGFLGYASSFAERRPGALVVLATFVVGASSTGMSLLGWNEDAYLFMLGTLAFSCALIGLAARRQRSRGWATPHIIAMSTSYVVPLTAFHVDNGHRLPLWKELPLVAFRIGPTLIAVPIVARALARHTHVRRHLRELAHLGAGPRGPRLIEPSTTDHQMADCGPEKTS